MPFKKKLFTLKLACGECGNPQPFTLIQITKKAPRSLKEECIDKITRIGFKFFENKEYNTRELPASLIEEIKEQLALSEQYTTELHCNL